MHELAASACEALPKVRAVRLDLRSPLPLGRQLRRGEEQEVLHRLPVVPDTAPRGDGSPVRASGAGEQAEVVRLLDHCAGGNLRAVCAESDHLPLLHTQQEHHHLGMPVLVQSQLPSELAAEVGVAI